MNYASRQKKLAAALRRLRVDALLVTHLPNVMYLCGFTGSSGALIVAADRDAKSVLVTDGRYTQQAAQEVQDARAVIGKRALLFEACQKIQRAPIKTLGFEAEHLSFASVKQAAQYLAGKVRL